MYTIAKFHFNHTVMFLTTENAQLINVRASWSMLSFEAMGGVNHVEQLLLKKTFK